MGQGALGATLGAGGGLFHHQGPQLLKLQREGMPPSCYTPFNVPHYYLLLLLGCDQVGAPMHGLLRFIFVPAPLLIQSLGLGDKARRQSRSQEACSEWLPPLQTASGHHPLWPKLTRFSSQVDTHEGHRDTVGRQATVRVAERLAQE